MEEAHSAQPGGLAPSPTLYLRESASPGCFLPQSMLAEALLCLCAQGAQMEKAYSAQPGGLALSPKPAPHSPSPLGAGGSIFAPDAAKMKPMGLIKPVRPSLQSHAHRVFWPGKARRGALFRACAVRHGPCMLFS